MWHAEDQDIQEQSLISFKYAGTKKSMYWQNLGMHRNDTLEVCKFFSSHQISQSHCINEDAVLNRTDL